MPNVEFYFHILQYVQVSNGLNHYFLSDRVHRRTHMHTETQTDGHAYSIVAVDNYNENCELIAYPNLLKEYTMYNSEYL